MNKKIIIGSLLAVFMMLMVPSIPAVQFNTVKEANESQLFEKIYNIDFKELKEKINDKSVLSRYFGNFLKGILGNTAVVIALGIILAIFTIFVKAIGASINFIVPLISTLVKITSMIHGTVFGLATQALRAIMIVAILLLF